MILFRIFCDFLVFAAPITISHPHKAGICEYKYLLAELPELCKRIVPQTSGFFELPPEQKRWLL